MSSFFRINSLGFFLKRGHPPQPVGGEEGLRRFVFAVRRLEKYLARRIFRAKLRRGVIIPCIAVDSFKTHTHTHARTQ